MSLAAGLLALALLAQPRPMYHWKDAQGQPHVTNTPPPPGAELVEAPPPPAVEPGRPDPPFRPRAKRSGLRVADLSPAQQAAWKALDQHMAKARERKDTRTLAAVSDSLIDDCLWGGGLWALLLLPLLSIALLGLLGWWLALGLGTGARLPLLGGFLLAGAAFGQLLLASFLFHPQAQRLRENLELLEVHLGGKVVSSANQALLQQRFKAVEDAADPIQPPWRFPARVADLRRDMRRVVVDP